MNLMKFTIRNKNQELQDKNYYGIRFAIKLDVGFSSLTKKRESEPK
jgi:hypothetical protein